MRSFPSGHASLSFCGLTFTALYLASHFRYNDQRGHAYKTLVFYVPLFCAALIAVSRTADYHHHWSDVLAGSIMGCYIGWFGYRTYFPPVFDPTVLSDRPYPRRIPKPANLAHIGYRSGHLLPVDEDPYQVGSSGHSSSLQLTRPHASHVQLAVPEQSTAIQVDPDNQVPAITTVPPGSSYVNVARASHQVAHEEGEAEPKPVQPAAGNL
ncbi:hypothetical protein FBU59_001502 [Linderina macrospora]|uniref:Uncharacterized protein n=1 Tax=Linderina macrospora TaxID=4868 RepID=A0ACC1JE51_9FUNG|nr:hypothetical protein FBU59_001502 [Linderina macrospora]